MLKAKKKKTKKKKDTTKQKVERALEEVKQLSLEAEDFFDSIRNDNLKESENGNK